jgi:hypothetical protein
MPLPVPVCAEEKREVKKMPETKARTPLTVPHVVDGDLRDELGDIVIGNVDVNKDDALFLRQRDGLVIGTRPVILDDESIKVLVERVQNGFRMAGAVGLRGLHDRELDAIVVRGSLLGRCPHLVRLELEKLNGPNADDLPFRVDRWLLPMKSAFRNLLEIMTPPPLVFGPGHVFCVASPKENENTTHLNFITHANPGVYGAPERH